MKNLLALFSLLFFTFLFISADVFSAEPAPVSTDGSINKRADTVRIATHWQPLSQFSGIFAAVDKGYSQKHLPNKKIEIDFPHFPERTIEKVGTGEIDFSICGLAEALFYRILHPDNKIVLLSQVTQTTPLMLVVHSSDGIKTPQDLNGLRVQTWRGCDVMIRHFFQRYNVSPVLVPQSSSMIPFLYRSVDVACALSHNEYHTLLEHGLTPEDIQVFKLSDFECGFPGDGIYCLEKTYLEQPELCKGIVAAIQDGWTYAGNEANETQTLEIAAKYQREADVIASRSHQRWALRTYKLDLTVPYGGAAANGTDVLKETDFERILNLLKESDGINDKKNTDFPKYADFCPLNEKQR
ncbi:hypothetical protein FACS189427_10140 [Planctomycetales bacterium]|nr:hypothetical protein FACS189427_10140 [Planctomycetales bacterium]